MTITTNDTDPDYNAYLSLCEELSTTYGFDVFFRGVGAYTDEDITEYHIGVEGDEHTVKMTITIIIQNDQWRPPVLTVGRKLVLI